jgi:hypothetical protein
VPSSDQDDPLNGLLASSALDALAQHAGDVAPPLPASNEGLATQFFGAAYEFFQAWLAAKGGKTPGTKPCAIVLSRSIGQDIERLSAKKLRYFKVSCEAAIAGRLFIANSDLSIVAEVPTDACGSAAALGDRLESLGLQDAVHCLLLANKGEMILCRDGIDGNPTSMKVGPQVIMRFDPNALDRSIWKFHRLFTQTPSGYLRPWKGKSSDRVTIDQAELRISLMLAFYLGTIVGADNVGMEDQLPHGRADIKVAGNAMTEGLGPCAVECKVLRSREGTKSTSVPAIRMVEHASEGIQQAVEYRLDLEGTLAYLCCFDARLKDEDQPEIVKLAADNDVILRRYFMYDSPKSHREAALAAKKAGTLLAGEVA